MDKQKLHALVNEGLSQREIADKTNSSQTSVRYWLAKHELKTIHAQRIEREIFYDCALCGCVDQNNFYESSKGSWCKDCHNKICINRQRERKREFVDYKGGKCESCGYDRCLGSLQFHHRDPNCKDPNWKLLKSRSLANAKEELDKCDLLCSNCHGEHHWDEVTQRRNLVDP
jgi:hypothetical protein